MQTTINIQKAGTKNFDAICQLLSEEHLPTTDLNPLLENFFVAAENNEIAGVIGMDKYGDVGLLRSVIIKKSYRKKGIAAALINQVFIIAKKQNMVA
ncbi:MAG: GNAT family N-acetyltransferase, partial [Bacteroidota bacterium]